MNGRVREWRRENKKFATCALRDLQVQGFSIFAKGEGEQDSASEENLVLDGVLMHINAGKHDEAGELQDEKLP